VYVLYRFDVSSVVLLIASLVAAAGFFAITYLFFMTVGSLVYDNEEKAFRLEKANAQLRVYADWIRGDLERARAVQQMLLPDFSNMPMSDRLEWGTVFVPEEEVGGDYFDAALLKDGRMAVLFADVSGHGLAAALITAIIKATFQGWSEGRGPVEEFVVQLNKRLFDLTPRHSFAAVAIGIFDPSSMVFTYCNCGHNPEPYLLRHDEERPLPLDRARNMILGAWEKISPVTALLQLHPGDTLFFATDGITEASDLYKEMYTAERLEQFLSEHRFLPVAEMVERLISDVESHSHNAAENDDRAVLAFRVR
jgi:sigma-B regulation protein RsbU (phosphoserine phosphatase)